MNDWSKKAFYWIKDRILHVSIPFTWELPKVRQHLQQRSMFWDRAFVGGPAVELMPDYFANFDFVSIGHEMPGLLQKINPLATKTTIGCINRCPFCAVPKIEGKFKELDDWPDLPIICDNNLLASSQPHFDRVIDRLKSHGWADFNQGLDARLLNYYHAKRISEIQKPIVRLALDSMKYADHWEMAFEMLRSAGLPLNAIRTYALIGFDSDPDEAWIRCDWIEKHGIKVLPMWFHPLDALEKNQVTEEQEALGWNNYKRRKIMQWFYQHKKAAI